MSSLYLLIPIAIIFVIIAIVLFIWAVTTDQFEDLNRQGANILFDDEHHARKDPQNNSGNHDEHKS